MTTSDSLRKNTKKLQGKGPMHLKSRRYKQVQGEKLRNQRVAGKKASSQEQREKQLQLLHYLKENLQLNNEQTSFTLAEMKILIENYLGRFDAELEALQSERRPGRPPSNRQLALEQIKKQEQHIYDTGYRIPNLLDENTVALLKKWNGTSGGISAFQYISITKDMQNLPTKDVDIAS